MRRRGGGTIVNITGTTQQAVSFHTPGSACNAAIRMFSKEISIELGPLNIRVNSLAPGRIQTARPPAVIGSWMRPPPPRASRRTRCCASS